MNTSDQKRQTEKRARDNLLRLFVQWWRRQWREIDRAAVSEQVFEEGGLSYAYVFLVITSCGIATLGLMLNSAAVIIGAMLIAPMMGPIVLLGFAIAATDVEKAMHSAKALAVGVVAALAIAAVIVKLSPYIAPTPEILARTRPNLFDLVVAVLSGLVAGYAVTHHKIGAVAGVAIATALMPPLAASGYGLAMGDMAIFQGAFFLFLTNMVAIALTVAGMATWYGFINLRTPKHLVAKTVAAGAVLAVLSIPLVRTLNESVAKTLTVNQVESVLRQELKLKGGALDKLDVRLAEGEPVHVSAVVFTREFDKAAHDRLLPLLRVSLGREVDLALDQVVMGDALLQARDAPSVLANPVGAAFSAEAPVTDAVLLVRHLRKLLPLPLAISEVDVNTRAAKLQVAPEFAGSLRTLQQMEANLQKRFPDWNIAIIPPMRPLPGIRFVAGGTELAEGGNQALKTSLWALARWQVRKVQVSGGAALNENGRETEGLALERTELVAEQVRAAGLETEPLADYPVPGQDDREKEQGQAASRVVHLQPLFEEESHEAGTAAPITQLAP